MAGLIDKGWAVWDILADMSICLENLLYEKMKKNLTDGWHSDWMEGFTGQENTAL